MITFDPRKFVKCKSDDLKIAFSAVLMVVGTLGIWNSGAQRKDNLRLSPERVVLHRSSTEKSKLEGKLTLFSRFDKKITALGVSVSCGCTITSEPPDSLLAGQRTVLDVVMNVREGEPVGRKNLLVSYSLNDEVPFSELVELVSENKP